MKVIKFDYSKLKGRIVEKCGNSAGFARAMVMKPGSVSSRLRNGTPWNDQDIARACEVLQIDPGEIPAYFFAPKF